mgnify:CR=1 FL=1
MALLSALCEATTGWMWRPEAKRALSMALRSEGSDMASTRDFGSWVVMGHNGVGQLGIAPSRPVNTPLPAGMQGFASMAFAYHMSCGWNPEGPVVCAGLDDALRPRSLDMPLGADLQPIEVERGDGTWVPIPSVSDVIALDSDGQASCALDRAGTVWCWGDTEGGAGALSLPPTAVTLPEGVTD